MGSALAEQHLGRAPRVAILNIGAEEIKGNDLIEARYAEMLSNTRSVNFIGYIEGNQLLQDAAGDVVVCWWFLLNISWQTCEEYGSAL